MKIPLLDLKAQYKQIKEEIDAAIAGVLDSCRFILGPEGGALEEELAAFCGVRYAIAVANGTDALLLALRAAGVQPGDEVITTTYTFFSTAETVAQLGAVPVFVDVDPRTLNLDLSQVKNRLTRRTKAVIPVHIFGQMVDVERLLELIGDESITVIEDTAQAIGARYRDRSAGSIGRIGTLSFFPTKNLGAYGDAGMTLTNDPDLAAKMRSLRFHGCQTKYYHDEIGYNSRLDELQAAILRVKLRYLDAWNQARREKAARYDRLLSALAAAGRLTLPGQDPEALPVYHLYTLRTQRRDALKKELDAAGIGNGIYYPLPLHLQKAFADLGYTRGSLPVAEKAAAEALAIPCYPELTEAEQDEIVEVIKRVFGSEDRHQ